MLRFARRRLVGLFLVWGFSSFCACGDGAVYSRFTPGSTGPGAGGTTEDAASSPDALDDAGVTPGDRADSGAGGGGISTGGRTGAGGITAAGGQAATGGASSHGGAGGPGQGVAGGSGAGGGMMGGRGGAAAGTGGAATGGMTAAGGSSGGRGGSGGATGGGTSAGSGGLAGGGGAAGGSAGSLGSGAGHGGTSNGGAGGVAGAPGVTQRILSLDFVGGVAAGGAGGLSGAVSMGPTEIAGVKPASNWNAAPGPSGSLSALVLSDGTPATGATATWNAPTYATGPGTYTIGYADMPGDVRMLNGYLDPSWSAAPSSPVTVVSFSGLPSALTAEGYDVYVYVVGGVVTASTRGYSYTIGTKTSRVIQTGPISTSPPSPYPYVLAPDGGSGNYIVFRKVTGAAFNIQVKPDSGGTVFRSPINGVEIVWPSGS